MSSMDGYYLKEILSELQLIADVLTQGKAAAERKKRFDTWLESENIMNESRREIMRLTNNLPG